jgi:tRNA1(Val) A37 N6-methylase TrmN6
VFLARKVFELLRDEIRADWRVLDLCAGCGIVGMDFMFHCHRELRVTPAHCDFLEVQEIYRQHFEINRQRLGLEQAELRFLNQNYNQPLNDQYDLILSNPPYFDPRAGKLSPNEFKNRCRFFMDASHDELLACLGRSLSPRGRAYVLTRASNPPPAPGLDASPVCEIRGTPLIGYQRSILEIR